MRFGRTRLLVAVVILGILAGIAGAAVPARATLDAPRLLTSALPPPGSDLHAQTIGAPPFPYADTFKLHSTPGADRVIYLDFDGELLMNTSWNQEFGPIAIDAVGYDTDGNPSTFSDSERAVAQSVWQRVAEDYAPFAIDVTTEDPGFNAIDRSGPADLNYGTRALITNTTVGVTECSCGGAGYVGVFDRPALHAFYQPALVFQRGAGSSAKILGEVASHEVGHNLGLEHDGTTAYYDYYPGHGPWAPIMGESYTRPVTQFSKGEYGDPTRWGNANNLEDDFAVMASHGAPPVADDAGDTPATAAGPLDDASTTPGVIANAADTDVFSLVSLGGSVTVHATPATVGPNLDIKLAILDAGGAVLASADPAVGVVSSDIATGLDASVTLTLPAGNFFVRVQGAGYGDPLTTGYSNYGSVGRYSVTANGAVSTPLPVLSVNDVVVGEGHTGLSNANFVMTLTHPSAEDVSFLAATTSATATAGADFVAFSQRLTIPAGQTTSVVAVSVVGDRVPEPHETFTLTLSDPVGATIGDGSGSGVIINDDGVGVAISDVDQLEGSGVYTAFSFTVSLSAKAPSALSVWVGTGKGTATAMTDFGPVARRVTFLRGEQTKTFVVVVRGDRVVEPDEKLSVWLSSPVGVVITDALGVGTIRNDD